MKVEEKRPELRPEKRFDDVLGAKMRLGNRMVPPRRAPVSGLPGSPAAAKILGTKVARTARDLALASAVGARLRAALERAHGASAKESRDRAEERQDAAERHALAKAAREGDGGVVRARERARPGGACREAPREPAGHPEDAPALRSALAAPGGGTETAAQSAAARAEQIASLVERVQAFVREGRPALELELGAGNIAAVAITRVGEGAVSLRIRSRGATRPEAEQEIRRALAERGLEVRELSWA
jgi:hypothetical protein